jgi:glycosyltransferase involved in cell wall biosynthesis
MEELVLDGKTGALAAPGNAVDLARAINKLIQDDSLASMMGEAGYLRAKALFDAHKNARATFEVYEEISG